MLISRDLIVSASDMAKNFNVCAQLARDNEAVIIFKNNKPDLVLMDIDKYENLLNQVEALKK